MSGAQGSIGTSLLVFLAGAAVGAVIVALTTPKAGPELFEDLQSASGKVRDKLNHLRSTCGKTWEKVESSNI